LIKTLIVASTVASAGLLQAVAASASELIIVGSTAAAASGSTQPTESLPVTLTRPTESAQPTTRPTLPTVKLTPDTPVAAPQPVESQPTPTRTAPMPAATGSQTARPEIEARVAQAMASARSGDRRSGLALCNAMLRAKLNAAETRMVQSCAMFDIPLLELRELMTTDRMRAADKLVTHMLSSLPDESEHIAYLQSIKQVTAETAPPEDPDGPGAHTMSRITRVLENYRQSRGYFPRNYGELNRLLPANTPPLVDYDIINYANVNNGFSIEIRNRENPKEVLSLHKSSLID